MIKSLNVAMIGGGFMGKAHAMAYAAMPMFFWPAPAIPHRKVVVDVTDVLAEEARQRFGFAEASSDWMATISLATTLMSSIFARQIMFMLKLQLLQQRLVNTLFAKKPLAADP